MLTFVLEVGLPVAVVAIACVTAFAPMLLEQQRWGWVSLSLI